MEKGADGGLLPEAVPPEGKRPSVPRKDRGAEGDLGMELEPEPEAESLVAPFQPEPEPETGLEAEPHSGGSHPTLSG